MAKNMAGIKITYIRQRCRCLTAAGNISATSGKGEYTAATVLIMGELLYVPKTVAKNVRITIIDSIGAIFTFDGTDFSPTSFIMIEIA